MRNFAFTYICTFSFYKNIIITGASGGIGNAIVKRLYENNANILATGTKIEKLNELKTDNVEPLTSVAETTLKLRPDEVKSKDIREQIIKNLCCYFYSWWFTRS